MLTALNTAFDGKKLTVTPFNRRYELEYAFPSAIFSGGEDVLAAPIRLNAGFRGKVEPWANEYSFLTERDNDHALYHAQASAGHVKLNARVTIEKDGLLWYDVLLVPHGKVGVPYRTDEEVVPTLDFLELEIPLRAEVAQLYHYWPVNDTGLAQCNAISNSGEVPESGLAIPFKPCVWLGKEEAGLAFYAESDETWQPNDPARVIRAEKKDGAVTLRVRLLDCVPDLWHGKTEDWKKPLMPLAFSFGLQATPSVPFEKRQSFERVYHTCIRDMPEGEEAQEAHFAHLEELGVKWRTLHEDWSLIQNYGLPRDPAAFKRMTRIAHKHGVKVMVYFGYEFSTIAPKFFEDAERDLIKTESGTYSGGWQRYPEQRDYMVCYAGGYGKTLIERVKYVMDELGVDGIYTDGTYIPWECANENHGCGYRGRDGKLHKTFPLRALRRQVTELHDVVHSRGGIVEAHQSSCCVPMILGYADSYFDGEHVMSQFDGDREHFFNAGAIRAEFSGLNFGVPIQYLLPTKSYLEGCGVMMLYGVPSKPYMTEARLEEAAGIWRILDAFGATDDNFRPFWRGHCRVKSLTEGVFCSTWERENRVLALAVNLSGEKTTARLAADGAVNSVRVASGGEIDGLALEMEPVRPYFVELELER